MKEKAANDARKELTQISAKISAATREGYYEKAKDLSQRRQELIKAARMDSGDTARMKKLESIDKQIKLVRDRVESGQLTQAEGEKRIAYYVRVAKAKSPEPVGSK